MPSLPSLPRQAVHTADGKSRSTNQKAGAGEASAPGPCKRRRTGRRRRRRRGTWCRPPAPPRPPRAAPARAAGAATPRCPDPCAVRPDHTTPDQMIGRKVAKKWRKLPVGAGGRAAHLRIGIARRVRVWSADAWIEAARVRAQIWGRAEVLYWSCGWPRGIARHMDESRRGLRRMFWSRAFEVLDFG